MLGILLEGGGLRAGFVTGALMALMDRIRPRFDLAVAVSASVPTLAYFVTGQRREMEQVWRYELCTPKFVHWAHVARTSFALSTKTPILDIQYLVERLLREKYPLRLDALRSTPILCRFAAAKAPEGTLSLLAPDADDVYQIIKACVALPGGYPSTISVNGGEYLDGGVINPLPARALLGLGADRFVAILSQPLLTGRTPPNLLERAVLWQYFRRYEWVLERLEQSAKVYAHEMKIVKALSRPPDPVAFVICPEQEIPMRFITRDRAKINRAINLGYRRVLALEKPLRAFLGAHPSERGGPLRPESAGLPRAVNGRGILARLIG